MKTILLYCSLVIVIAGALVAGGIEPPSKKVAALSTVSKAVEKPEKVETNTQPSTTETPVSVDETATQAVVAPAPDPAPVIDVAPAAPAEDYESEAKAFIYQHESGGRTDAINASSGACGLGQALPCSKLPCTLQDYSCQDNWFTQYAYNRYGSWSAAKSFWQAHSWW